MSVRVREARPEEDALIGERLLDSFLRQYAAKMPEVLYDDARKAELRDTATKRALGKVWVAEVDGRLAGTVWLLPPGAPQTEAWLPLAVDVRQLAVFEGFNGQGVSRALMDSAEADAWAQGAQFICLHVRRGAVGVAQMYRQRGYRREIRGDLDLPTVFLEAYVLPRP